MHMHTLSLSLLLSTLIPLIVTAAPAPSPAPPAPPPPPFFILAGDSTTATQSPGGGGWGDGFLNTTLFNGASGVNKGHNGATTLSFRQQGFWQDVLSLVQQHAQQHAHQPYVTIQFGHNDQKIKNLTLAHFQSNLEHFAQDVARAGGLPILITPLSRRNYITDESGREVVEQDLAQQRAATIRAAQASGTAWIDLNAASVRYLDAIGPQKAWSYNLEATDDHTHLNGRGSEVFGGLVAELMLENGELGRRLGGEGGGGYVRVNRALEEALRDGEYFWPSS